MRPHYATDSLDDSSKLTATASHDNHRGHRAIKSLIGQARCDETAHRALGIFKRSDGFAPALHSHFRKASCGAIDCRGQQLGVLYGADQHQNLSTACKVSIGGGHDQSVPLMVRPEDVVSDLISQLPLALIFHGAIKSATHFSFHLGFNLVIKSARLGSL